MHRALLLALAATALGSCATSRAGAPLAAPVTLPPEGATLTGVVRGAAAGADVYVMALPVADDPLPSRALLTTAEASGRFALRGVPQGRYRLLAASAGATTAAPALVEVDRAAPPPQALSLVRAPVQVTLEVAPRGGDRPGGLRAIAWDAAGVPHLGIRDGLTITVPVAAGVHRVTIDARGYQPARAQVEAGARHAIALEPRVRVLLVSGADDFHDWRATSGVMRDALEATGRYDVRLVEDVAILGAPDALASYATVILNAQVRTAPPAVREGLTRYLEGGGGLVALHWVIAAFPDWPEFANVLGRAWSEARSGEDGDHPFRIAPVRGHPITAGLAPFVTSDDDMLHYDLVGDAPIEVLATATNASGTRTFPVLWTREVGRGRVVFASFGHSAAARLVPGVREAWLRAVEWTARSRP